MAKITATKHKAIDVKIPTKRSISEALIEI